MNKKIKMMMLALGVGLSTGAFAFPGSPICEPPETAECKQMRIACEVSGDYRICERWINSYCTI